LTPSNGSFVSVSSRQCSASGFSWSECFWFLSVRSLPRSRFSLSGQNLLFNASAQGQGPQTRFFRFSTICHGGLVPCSRLLGAFSHHDDRVVHKLRLACIPSIAEVLLRILNCIDDVIGELKHLQKFIF